MELYLLRPSFAVPSARDMSRYLVIGQPRHGSTLGLSEGSSIYERACAHCHNGRLVADLRRQTVQRHKLIDVVEGRGRVDGCLFRPIMIRDLFTDKNRESLEAFLRGDGAGRQ